MATHDQTCSFLRIYNNSLALVQFIAQGPNGEIARSGNVTIGERWDFRVRDHSGIPITIKANVKGGKNPQTFQVNSNYDTNYDYLVELTETLFKTSFYAL